MAPLSRRRILRRIIKICMMNLDEFANNVKVLPPITIEDEGIDFYKKLYKVFMKIPDVVKDEVINNVTFFAMTKSNLGQYFKTFYSNNECHIIFLNWTAIIDEIEEIQLSIIAHEIAHYILRHTDGSDENENEADELIVSWGFSLNSV